MQYKVCCLQNCLHMTKLAHVHELTLVTFENIYLHITFRVRAQTIHT